MPRHLNIFLSNHLELLYEQLKERLFGTPHSPLERRIVVVYGPAMKNWLMLRLAQDPTLQIAIGIEFVYLNQAFDHLLKAISSPRCYFPSSLELALTIEQALFAVLQNFYHLSPDEQRDWKPLIDYFKVYPRSEGKPLLLSRKMEKRLIGLSGHLAHLFQEYGRYGKEMVAKWESPACPGWQPRLWRQLFSEKKGWHYPARALQKEISPSLPLPFTLHFFSISFLSKTEFSFLDRLGKHLPLYYYLLSPCAVFWSDIRSDRENAYLHTYWQQRMGALSSYVLQLEEFLRDRNPLLANFGRLGRQMAYQIEESQAETHAIYRLPSHAEALNPDLPFSEDLFFVETAAPLSLLHAVQADLLFMRNPQGKPPFHFEEERGSIQLHIAPNRRREVQILSHYLLGLMTKDRSILPSHVLVMAPDIREYIPYIQSIFGGKESQLDFQILDLGLQTQSEITQGFLHLLELSESGWEAGHILQLFEHRFFQRRHQLLSSDYVLIQKWVEHAHIRWGEDWIHRNEVLLRRHCEKGMAEETPVGTWEDGITRLLLGLTTLLPKPSSMPLEEPPCSVIEMSQSDLLEKFLRLLHALQDDLSPLQDRTAMTIEDWTHYFLCLLDSYFQPDFLSPQSVEEHKNLKEAFEVLNASARPVKEALFPFASVKSHLLSLLQQRHLIYRENHLQAVRFCSLVPLRSIPAKVIALIGMQEEAFPRTRHPSSLNLMLKEKSVDYSPLAADEDRYLFLEALHAAQDYLFLSYPSHDQKEGKEGQAALVVEELFSYLDRFFRIKGEKISQRMKIKHPFDSFHKQYFQENSSLSNFSLFDFQVAKIHYSQEKESAHQFLKEFKWSDSSLEEVFPSHHHIEIKQLSKVARHPIKFHLNKRLEIYLPEEEGSSSNQEEEWVLSSLDRYQLKQSSLKEPIERVLHRAEKEGKLPLGLFKTVATKRLKEEVDDLEARLHQYGLKGEELFQIEFCAGCLRPTQVERDHWIFPPLSLSYEKNDRLSLTGKLSHVTPRGLFVLSKGGLSDLWKVWPEFLLYCYAAKVHAKPWEPQLIFAQAVHPKKAFFDDPLPYLKQFIHYYSLCLKQFSPLIPDWLSLILNKDAHGLQEKMRQLYGPSFGAYQDPYLRWVLNKNLLPDCEALVREWGPQAQLLLQDLVRFWYPRK